MMPSDEFSSPPGSTREAPEEVHRLHPLSILFRMGGALRSLFLPLVLFVFFSSKGGDLVWIAWAFGVSTVYAVTKYVTCRYRFSGDEMVVTGGLFFRSERHVPYARIQNIDLSQSVFHRLLRVADVRIETASGSEAEAHLQVLSVDAVERMRRRVFANREPDGAVDGSEDSAPAPPDTRSTILHLGTADLVTFGLLSNRGMAVALAALGLAYEFELFSEEQLQQLENLDHFPLEEIPGLGAEGPAWPLLAAGGVVVILIALRLLSVAWALWKLFGFTLERDGDDLRTTCGLFTRLTATIPRRRIQVITVIEGWLHRMLGLAAVKVDTAGGSQLEAKAATRSWVAPLIRRDRLDALLHELQPGLGMDQVEWRSVHPCGRARLARRRCAVLALLGLVASWWWTPWVLTALPVLWMAAVWEARLRIAVLGYGLDDVAFTVRSGLWTRRTRLLRCAKIQVVDLRESPFDRHWGTASLGVDVAGTDAEIHVPFLDEPVAAALRTRIAERVEALSAGPRLS